MNQLQTVILDSQKILPKYGATPWSEVLDNYKNHSELELSIWTEQDIFYPMLISAYMEDPDLKVRNTIKKEVWDALQKWRTPGVTLLHIYPTKEDWKEGIAFLLLL